MNTAVTASRVGPARPRRLPTTLSAILGTATGRTGVILLVVILIAILIGPLLLSHGADTLDPAAQLRPPSIGHLLGTDEYGRDELARVLVGGRRSLLLVSVSLAASLAIGLTVGVLAGVAGGILDAIVLRVLDVFLTLPGLVLTLALIGTLGAGPGNLMISLAAAFWPQYARLARSYIAGGRARPDVLTARAAGISWARVARGHLVPEAASNLLVIATLDVGHMIMAITGLSFLGLGVQAPAAEWGAMLADARDYITTAPWLLAAPGVAIMLCILAANLLGETIAQATAPRVVR